MCPAGDSPVGVTIGSSVARRAEQRVTNDSEAPRQPHPWDGGKFSGRNESEREVAPKSNSPGGRARGSEGEGSTVRRRPIDRRIAPAGWLATAREQGHIEQLEKPSLSRPERAEAG